MSVPVLYAHPFSSYSQKVLIAFYERDVPFELRVSSSENEATIAEKNTIWPLGKFPVLHADGRTFVESSVIIEWLDQRGTEGQRLIPDDPDGALEVRMLDRIFDNYVMTPMMTLVFDRLRPEDARDALSVRMAHEMLDKALAWLDARMMSREWAAIHVGGLHGRAGAALRTGFTPSARRRRSWPTSGGCWCAPRSPVASMTPARPGICSPAERPRAIGSPRSLLRE